MKNVKKLVLAATALAITTISGSALSADRTNMHGTDHRWMQFNFVYHIDELPQAPHKGDRHNYLETEFGGRSGMLDYYGYVDVFNVANQTTSHGDKNPDAGQSKMFMEIDPRLSLDAITGEDLSFGPVKELYLATVFKWSGLVTGKSGSTETKDGATVYSTNNSFWGIGADINVPWLGTTSMNLYGYYDMNLKDWNGYQFSTNWFKPFYFFKNKSFISFQGYLDYQFGADTDKADATSSGGGDVVLGLYWHSDHYAVGYGLKLWKNAYLIKDGNFDNKTTGVSHIFSVTYVL